MFAWTNGWTDEVPVIWDAIVPTIASLIWLMIFREFRYHCMWSRFLISYGDEERKRLSVILLSKYHTLVLEQGKIEGFDSKFQAVMWFPEFHLPGPSLSWTISKFHGTRKNWPSMAILSTWPETYFRQDLFPSYLFSRRQFHAIVIFRPKSISDLDSESLPRFFGEFTYMKLTR